MRYLEQLSPFAAGRCFNRRSHAHDPTQLRLSPSRSPQRGAPLVAADALFFTVSLLAIAIVPLMPIYTERFSLSKLEAGSLFAAASLTTVVVSVPAGMLADRFGATALTRISAALVCVSAVGHAVAVDFWSLLAARALFGCAYGVAWTAGVAYLAGSVVPARRAAVLGALVPISGVANMVGPAVAGFAADRFGLGVPFLAVAGAAGIVFFALAAEPAADPAPLASESLRATARGMLGDHLVRAGLTLMILGGVVSTALNLLAPLQLRENGLSPGMIGIVFSAGSALFVGVSAVVAHLGSRPATPTIAGAGSMLQGAILVIGVASGSTAALTCLIVLRSLVWAGASTIAYAIGTTGAARAGLPRGTVIGLMNVAWGAASFISPLLAGELAQVIGERPVYALLAVLTTAAGFGLLAQQARDRGRRSRQISPPPPETPPG
jgi:MFS family permease